MNKDFKSPWQIIKKLKPRLDIELAGLSPVMLDCRGLDYITHDELSLKRYDLLCYP